VASYDVASIICQALHEGHLLPRAEEGKAVQVEPKKPMLKARETIRLTLNCDKLLSSFAFNFNLRRYKKAGPHGLLLSEIVELTQQMGLKDWVSVWPLA